MSKQILILFISTIFSFSTYALDLTETGSDFADSFESFVDDNEGLTTFRSLNIPIGGRAESLGTACVALCDDILFFDYNPAVSSVLPQTEIAVFHNAWIADSAMETISATTRNENFGYGGQIKCFYVPFSEYNLFGDRVAGSYYSETSLTFNMSYNFLAGYNFRGLALGYNVRASWRNVPNYTDNKTDEIIKGSGLSQSALAFMTDLGLLVRFNVLKLFSDRNPNMNIGLSLSNIGVALTGFGNTIQLDDSLPTRLNFGIAYRIASPILLVLEFRQPLNILDFSSTAKFSACSGLEIRVTKFCDFDLGFLLQGGNPRISLGSGFSIKKVRLNVNYTFDLTSSVNPINHISLSAKMLLGDKGRSARQSLVDSHYIEGLSLYSQGKIDEAIEEWNVALELDKTFDPAREARNAAIRFNKAKDDIMNMQKLDVSGSN